MTFISVQSLTATPRRAFRGFTLIELMVVVALMAILAGLAAPSFTAMLERYRIDNARSNWSHSVELARIQAIRTGFPVVMQAAACPNANWNCGWSLFVDANRNGVRDAADQREAIFSSADAQPGIAFTSTTNATASVLNIDQFGQSGNSFFTLSLRPDNSTSHECGSLTISSALRIRKATC